MENVIEQARLLGIAIAESQEHLLMREAEEAVTQNDETADKMRAYAMLKNQVQNLLGEEDPDQALLSKLSQDLEKAQEELNGMPLIQQMVSARADFTQMMNQVNQVIQFMITGEEPADCGGDCGGCSGCGHAH